MSPWIASSASTAGRSALEFSHGFALKLDPMRTVEWVIPKGAGPSSATAWCHLRNSPLTGEHGVPIYRGVVMRKGLGWLVLPLFMLVLGIAQAQPGKVTYVYTDP